MELLQLSDGNANRYLLDIDTEIQRQSEFLDKVEGRLEAAKKLREEVAKLQRLYESGTAATMRDLLETGKTASCRLLGHNIETLTFSTFATATTGPCPVQHVGACAD
jgi:hypothetical protein